jgi:hypothetical protein
MTQTNVSKLAAKQPRPWRVGQALGKILAGMLVLGAAVASSAIVIGLIALAVIAVKAAFG